MPTLTCPPRLGWLFAYDWDAQAATALQQAGRARIDRGGFDLFSFPGALRLPGFDLQRFADAQARRGRRLGWRGVLSHHEQFGALAASLVAEQLGLPGTPPESILAAQHKAHARQILARVAPEASIDSRVLPMRYGDPVPPDLGYPAYVKPVKAAFSVLARAVHTAEELQAHTRFGRYERFVIHHLVEPFDRVCRARLPQAGSAHRLLMEATVPAATPQYNLDGWVQDAQVHALGVVDAVMVPGTQQFMRWEHPSRLPAAVQQRALDVARRFLNAIGFRQGCFNLEFFHDPVSDRLTVIECNPRLASQFGDLYRRVQGRDPHAIALALALGEDASALPCTPPSAGAAASLVYRALPGEPVPAPPGAAQRAAFARQWPDGLLFALPKSGGALARDYKWTGSHRYGIVHLGAVDRAALQQQAEAASAVLGWPAPYRDRAPVAAPAGRGMPAFNRAGP